MKKNKAIEDTCNRYGIALVYLFGSCAEKAYHSLLHDKTMHTDDPLTDIDIGVVFTNPLPTTEKRYLLFSDLYNAFADMFHPIPIDLVFLEENHAVFQVEALKGRCIYAISDRFKDNYEEMVLRRAADFKPVLDLFFKEVLEEVKSNA